jgi:hypothetical protein
MEIFILQKRSSTSVLILEVLHISGLRKQRNLDLLFNSTSMKLMGCHLISVLGVVHNFTLNL